MRDIKLTTKTYTYTLRRFLKVNPRQLLLQTTLFADKWEKMNGLSAFSTLANRTFIA